MRIMHRPIHCIYVSDFNNFSLDSHKSKKKKREREKPYPDFLTLRMQLFFREVTTKTLNKC